MAWMRRPILFLTLIAPLAAAAWVPETAQLIARDSAQNLPPAMLSMIRHFPDPFNAGFTDAKPAQSRPELEAQLIAQGETLTGLMQQTGELQKCAHEWGVFLRLAIEAGDPFLGAPLSPPAARLDYDGYIGKSARKVRRALYLDGYEASADERVLFTAIANRAIRYADNVRAAYLPDGARRSELDFDDRSNVFGATMLAWNRAASDAAALATRVWQRGGGDITGSPFLPRPAAPAAAHAAKPKAQQGGLLPGSFENHD